MVVAVRSHANSSPAAGLCGGFEPAFGDLGLDDVSRGSGVAVPQLGHVEPHDVKPLRLRVGSIPCLVLGGGTLVSDRCDFPSRAAHVLRGARVEDHRKLSNHHSVADPELRLARPAGVYLRITFSDRVLMMTVAFDLRPVALELRSGLQRLSLESAVVTRLDLSHPFAQFTEVDVMLVEKNASDGKQPASVVGQALILRPPHVDVADPAALL